MIYRSCRPLLSNNPKNPVKLFLVVDLAWGVVSPSVH